MSNNIAHVMIFANYKKKKEKKSEIYPVLAKLVHRSFIMYES